MNDMNTMKNNHIVCNNPCDTCEYKNLDWTRIEEFKDFKTNPACVDCYKKECYEQSLRPTHNVSVDVAGNEILVKYTLKDKDLAKFICLVTKLTNHVNLLNDNVDYKYVEGQIEQNTIDALDKINATCSVISSPYATDKFLNGEYDDVWEQFTNDDKMYH